MANIKFETTPLAEFAHKMRLSMNTERSKLLKKALALNLTSLFFNDLKDRVENENNAIMGLFGPPGIGKTRCASFICYVAQQKFKTIFIEPPYKNILNFYGFNVIQIEKIFKRIGTKNLINISMISDEAGTKIFGTGSGREEQFIRNVYDTVRAQQVFMYNCGTDIFNYPHHWAIEPWGINRDYRLLKAILYSVESSKKQRLIPMGFILTGLPPTDLDVRYDKFKKANIRKVLRGKYDDRVLERNRRANQLVSNPGWFKCETKDDKRLLAEGLWPGYGSKELNLTIRRAEQIEKSLLGGDVG